MLSKYGVRPNRKEKKFSKLKGGKPNNKPTNKEPDHRLQ